MRPQLIACCCLLLALGSSPGMTQEQGKGLCKAGNEVAYLVGSELRAWPSEKLLVDWGDLTPLVVDCDSEHVAVGFRSRRGGRIEVLERGESGYERSAQVELKLVPEDLRILGGQLIVLAHHRKTIQMLVAAAEDSASVVLRPLREWPAGLAAAPSGERFLVAQGQELKSYLLPGALSREVLTFPAPLTALATHPGESRILVATEREIMLYDLRDSRERGVLPIRAQVSAAGPVVALFWLDPGKVAAALTRDPSAVHFLVGDSLTAAQTRQLDFVPAFSLARGPDSLLLMSSAGEVSEVLLSPDKAAAAERLGQSRLESVPLPPPAVGPAPVPEKPARGPKPKAKPSPRVTPVPRPAPEVEQAPVLEAKPPAEPASAPSPRSEPAAPVLLEDAVLPGGTIIGRLSGKSALAKEIVILGPDNILKEHARLVPEQRGDLAFFRLDGLPPGRYRVQPTGQGGASLALAPPFVDLVITRREGARADFRVLGAW